MAMALSAAAPRAGHRLSVLIAAQPLLRGGLGVHVNIVCSASHEVREIAAKGLRQQPLAQRVCERVVQETVSC